jgi:polyisoprenoid-binding protein YceI
MQTNTSARLSLLAGLALAALALADGTPDVYKVEKTHVDLLFSVGHFGFTQKHGAFRDLDATLTCHPENIEACRVEVIVRADSIDTGDEARDKDLRSERFFDTAKYPEIRFLSRKVTRNGLTGLTIEGDLTMHGVTKLLSLDATFNKLAPNPFDQRPTLGFSAHGTLKRSDFGITGLLPMIGDEVSIVIDAEFNRPKA